MPDAEMQRLSDLLAAVGNPDLEPTEGPLLVVQGSEDHDVPQFLTDDLVASLEAQGVDLTYRLYPGEGHDTVLGPSVCETLTWLADHGGPDPTSCEPAPTDLS
jgi:predicted esterase